MRVLAFIEEAAVIRKILDHLGFVGCPEAATETGERTAGGCR